MELKRLPFDKGEFPGASGKIYKIKNTLTVHRHSKFEQYQNHFAFNLSFEALYKRMNDVKDLFDKGKSVDAFYTFENLRQAIGYRMDERAHPALLLCSLFVVTEDEDLSEWNEDEQRVKIDDWNRAGYDVNDFFVLASNLVTGFLPAYEEIFQSISKGGKQPK